MKRMLFLFLAFMLSGLLRAQTSPTALVLRGGTLVDVASGKEIPDSTIVMRGERIEQVGSGNMGIPDGAQIIDAKGKWIIPGLIDSHAHAENPDETPFSLYLANGVTTIRNPGGNITVLRLTRERLLRGELIGPRLFFSGPVRRNSAGLARHESASRYTATGPKCSEFSGGPGRRLCEGL